MDVESLEPKECFRWFAALAKIPRESCNEKAASDFLVRFAEERGLFVSRDEANNVCVKKPGAAGMEDAPPVIVQGHMDMVCVKEAGSGFDFSRDPIKILVEGDIVRADGTTLGADNGIGLAFMLALLDSDSIPHPPLEAVFTTREEVDMGGAAAFDASQLSGETLINLDSETEGVFCVSCAGGRRSLLVLPMDKEPFSAVPDSGAFTPLTVSVDGLAGGHSGLEIHMQRGNAIRILARFLAVLHEQFDMYAASLSGGGPANVIPAESSAVVCVKAGTEAVRNAADAFAAVMRRELAASDGEGLRITVEETQAPVSVYSQKSLRAALMVAVLTPDGVVSMDLHIPEQRLVESSSNLGAVGEENGALTFLSMVRSSSQSRKDFICGQLEAAAALAGGRVENLGDYPSWEFSAQSPVRDVFLDAYKTLSGKEGEVEGIHAGLECGVFFEKLRMTGKKLDCIAVGPNIVGAHTTEEACSRQSVANTWALLQEVLRRLGARGRT